MSPFRKVAWALFLTVLAGCSPSPSAPAASTPTPAPSAFGCPPTPATPLPYPPPATPFAITFNPNPLVVGLAGPVGDRNTIVIQLDINVDATGALFGSITRVHRVLRERDSGRVLGEVTDSGPFLGSGGTPCRTFDPLLLYGHQNLSTGFTQFRANDPLGFQRRPSNLIVDLTIVDTAGGTWTVSKSVVWDLLQPPTPRTPVNITVRQNDPGSGCTFDTVHGYGLMLDTDWDPPPGNPPITHYAVSVYDGAGRLLPFNGFDRKRLVLCSAHVEPGAERGAKWAVTACVGSCVVESDFAVATFDFQSCREAGVPACQP